MWQWVEHLPVGLAQGFADDPDVAVEQAPIIVVAIVVHVQLNAVLQLLQPCLAAYEEAVLVLLMTFDNRPEFRPPLLIELAVLWRQAKFVKEVAI
eukprot:CAMPEP_0117662648 /NCGR_PEP_ID=MMETSP0804-20121206/8162_1 /TAXON_ID=1074897 /ORGANISM="Tetraselmis astigmatica, Strain CCMP880" /LENGTH=94 /DNA_ID=CAMNT_0005469555 /DNA_START=187 /DNA_END=472 /DNA_ORIENTATION=-